MLELDGSQLLGSGTIVRFSVAYAAITGTPLHLRNARAGRDKPGLRPQHLAAVRACAQLCGADVRALAVGSRDITFVPEHPLRGGEYRWEIGTAGSTTMLALAVLPLACFADAPLTATIVGGVFQDHAPSPHHMEHVLAPLASRMGAIVRLSVLRPGYVPGGEGIIELRVTPTPDVLKPLALGVRGDIESVRGIALASRLADRHVSRRMADSCSAELHGAGVPCSIACVDENEAVHPGANLAVWASTSTGCLIGADRAGVRGRRSEAIGEFVARALLADLHAQATVDRHAADQLVFLGAFADGATRYVSPDLTDHLETNLSLARQFGARVRCDGHQVEIEGIAARAQKITQRREGAEAQS